MIVVDGQQTDIKIQNFGNLEQLLVGVMDDGTLDSRIVTEVRVNDECFSEIYPHQAEDIESQDIDKVEIITMDATDMAVNITGELQKVVTLMGEGARTVADLFRQADDSEGLEMYQDLLDVTKDFFGMIGVLRDEFSLTDHQDLSDAIEELSELFGEIIDVTENEDWILLSDLLEYEYIPVVNKWKQVIANLREEIRAN